jgi:hypothetical protein
MSLSHGLWMAWTAGPRRESGVCVGCLQCAHRVRMAQKEESS